ncbi:hypothetical protein HYV82_00790, partial [Candidatus Woesearchaeota archaeon]|nr:hypothetical protein [Candidatus Woesearchaeota archaeon]
MPVEMCMESGQMQCNMDPSSTIGVLGSAHTHADFKVFIDGKPVDFARQKYYMKSSFIHLDDNQNKEDASGVIHMHATGVPLWVFFKSIGGNLNETCLSLDSGQFCNAKEKKLKFYVNGELRTEFGNYVFSDLDKMLISYGAEAEQEINQQLSAITSFAKEH